jgi:hypothetical protein
MTATTKTTTLGLALVLSALAAPATADGAADDLAAVKKAVASTQEARPLPEATPRPAPPRRGAEPQWLRVRIQEKGESEARVKVNLPLSLVRAIGDDLPLRECGKRRDDGAKMRTLGDVLRALDSGQSLVEIEDEDTTIRVWVE